MDNNRNKEIDILKVIAVIMVVYGHVLYNCAGLYSGFISYVHMPIFYIVSGYFLFNEIKKYDISHLILKKIKRFIIPYLIWSFISFIANSMLIIVSVKRLDLIKIYNEFFNIFIYSRSVWFLIQIFIAQMIFVLVYCATKKHKILNIIINLIVWFLVISFCNAKIFMMVKFKWLYGYFILGYIVALIRIDEKIKKINLRIILLFLSISALVWIIATVTFSGAYSTELSFGFDFNGFKFSNFVIEIKVILCGLSGIITIYLFSLLISKYRFSSIIYKMGDYTLDIYLIHMLFIFIIKHFPMFSSIGPIFILSFFYALIPISFGIFLLSKYILRRFKIYRMII